MSHVMNTYARLPVAFSHGNECRVTDTEGRATSTGCRELPSVRWATIIRISLRRLPRRLDDCCIRRIYRMPQQEQLADKLSELSGMEEVFFCNSGCEANEAAIKLARFYGHQQGVDAPAIIVMEHSFHGRTLATLSATGNRKGFTKQVRATCRRIRACAVQRSGCRTCDFRAQQECRRRHA